VPDKYDYNYFGNNTLSVSFPRVSPYRKMVDDLREQIKQLAIDKTTDFSKIKYLKGELKTAEENLNKDDSMRSILLTQSILSNKIPNKILSSILIDPKLGYMTKTVLAERAKYNATDAEYLQAQNSETGMSAVMDKGVGLLLNYCYILVFDSYERNETANDKEHPQNKTISINSSAYLYQIDVDSLKRNGQFYSLWVKPNEPAKLKEFQEFNFPIKFIMKIDIGSSTDNFETESNISGKSMLSAIGNTSNSSNLIKYRYKNENEINVALVNGLMSSADFKFTQKYEPFKVKVSVFSGKPILAKVGAKEGLEIDELFKVTETVLSKNGEKYDKKIGWVRVSSVSDNKKNADGKMDPSKFYKVSCKKVEKGMKMTLKKEMGIDLGFAYSQGGENNVANGPMFTAEYITRFKPGIRLGLSLGGFGTLSPDQVKADGVIVPSNVLKFEGTNIYADLTAQKILQANHIELTPQIGAYLSMLSINKLNNVSITEYETLKGLSNTAYGALAGIKLGYNFGPHFQLNFGYKIGFQIGSKLKCDGGEVTYGNDQLTMDFKSPNAAVIGFRIYGL
jgi:hypothetical protein